MDVSRFIVLNPFGKSFSDFSQRHLPRDAEKDVLGVSRTGGNSPMMQKILLHLADQPSPGFLTFEIAVLVEKFIPLTGIDRLRSFLRVKKRLFYVESRSVCGTEKMEIAGFRYGG